jgi:hypothetical protein
MTAMFKVMLKAITYSATLTNKSPAARFWRLIELDTNKLKPNMIEVSRMEVPGQDVFPMVKSENMGTAINLFLTSDGKESSTYIDVADLESLNRGIPELQGVISPDPKHLVIGNLGEENCFEYDFDSGSEMFFHGQPITSITVEGGLKVQGEQNYKILPSVTIVLKEPEAVIKVEVGFIRLECKPPAKVRRSFRPLSRK